MKTKLNLLILLVLAVFVSCNKVEVNPPQEELKPNIDDKFLLTTPYSVEIKSGYVTRVTLGDERLALTDIPMTIDIPKVATKVRSASDELKVEFLSYTDVPEFEKGSGISEKTHVLMFEDSRNGDYDYNDFIVLVKHICREEKDEKDGTLRYVYDFKVKPLALGATKSIRFGYQNENTGDYVYFSKDVRKDYFGTTDNKIMINTSKSKPFEAPLSNSFNKSDIRSTAGTIFDRILFESFEKSKQGEELMGGYYRYFTESLVAGTTLNRNVNYFIEVYDRDNSDKFGNKIFIAEVGVGSGAKFPYGLAIPLSIKTYPFENQKINQVFPQFDSWVKNTNSNLDWYNDGKDGEKGFDIDMPALYRWYSDDNWTGR